MRLVYRFTDACFAIDTTRYAGTPKQLLDMLDEKLEERRTCDGCRTTV